MNFDPSSMGENQYAEYQSPPILSVGSSSSSRFESDPEPEPRWWWLAARWRENHGNLLLLMTGLILLVGSIILAYQQNRVRPPAFPDSRTLQAARPLSIDDASSEEPSGDGDSGNAIEIRVTGASDASQPVRIAIYDHSDGFNDVSKAFLKRTLAVNSEGMVASTLIPQEELPSEFAIAAYHDADGNGELSRNGFKIPVELYGFSNDARGQFGPPNYTDALIERPPVGSLIEIRIR